MRASWYADITLRQNHTVGWQHLNEWAHLWIMQLDDATRMSDWTVLNKLRNSPKQGDVNSTYMKQTHTLF